MNKNYIVLRNRVNPSYDTSSCSYSNYTKDWYDDMNNYPYGTEILNDVDIEFECYED